MSTTTLGGLRAVTVIVDDPLGCLITPLPAGMIRVGDTITGTGIEPMRVTHVELPRYEKMGGQGPRNRHERRAARVKARRSKG